MKNSRFRLIINLCFYINIVMLSLFISQYGIANINGLWVVSPYVFILIYLSYFKMFYKKPKMYYGLLFILKFSIMIIGYISGQYEIFSIQQVMFFSLVLVLIFASHLLEHLFFFHNKSSGEYKEIYTLPSLSKENLALIYSNHRLKDLLMKARNMVSKLHFNSFGLVFSYALIVMSIIFQSSDNTRIIGIILGIVSVLLCISMLYYFYTDFVKKVKINKLLGAGILIFSFAPFTLFMFPNIVIQMENQIIFALLAIFAIPFWFLYNKEAKKVWTMFISEYQNTKDQNDD